MNNDYRDFKEWASRRPKPGEHTEPFWLKLAIFGTVLVLAATLWEMFHL